MANRSCTAKNQRQIGQDPLPLRSSNRLPFLVQKPFVVWLTGLSGAGKSTIGVLIEDMLIARNKHTMLLDGDDMRKGLNSDLGFDSLSRSENLRRASEVAKIMTEAGLVVIVSFISPFRHDRQVARSKFLHCDFLEVFVDTPLKECVSRDPKRLYAKAMDGGIKDFTGIDSPYEPPLNPDVHLLTMELSPEQAARRVMSYLEAKSLL
jgi:bifunctional enzyme CysN/CysC